MDIRQSRKLEDLRASIASGRSLNCRLLAVLREFPLTYHKGDLQFLEDGFGNIAGSSEKLSALKVLAKFGWSASECANLVKFWTPVLASAILDIAEAQGDAEAVLIVADALDGFRIRSVLALKKMGRIDYMTSFLMSGASDSMRDLILELMSKEAGNEI